MGSVKMDENTLAELQRIYAAVNYMSDLEGQDSQLIIYMSQAMLNDLIENGEIFPLIEYVKLYCDVIESPDDYQRIADDI